MRSLDQRSTPQWYHANRVSLRMVTGYWCIWKVAKWPAQLSSRHPRAKEDRRLFNIMTPGGRKLYTATKDVVS